MDRKVLGTRAGGFVLAALLGATAASGAQNVAAKQRLTVGPSLQTVAPGGLATVSIFYESSDSTLPGIALRLHYDSSKLELDGSKLLLAKSSMGHQDQPDRDRFDDGDPGTDRRYLAVWSDFGGNWPGADVARPLPILELRFRLPEGSTGGQLTLSATGCGGCRLELEPGTIKAADRGLQIAPESPTPTAPAPTATPTPGAVGSFDPPPGGGVAPYGLETQAIPTLSEVGGVVLGALLASSAVTILMRRGG